MKNYDFRILSPFEFECLSRDLLCKRDNLDFSNFAEGRDGGIDLRASMAANNTVIAQAKRYKSYPELKNTLKDEVAKVKKLNPSRYIVTTSVDLTAKNIDEIKQMFVPYIKSDNDVLGKQELNKLLGRFSDIELQYYKLWLSSTDVLNAFLKKRIFKNSQFEMDEIKRNVQTYVMNPSFDKARKILLTHKYVIISGVPGIGKTSLARMLVYFLLSKVGGGYEQFYFITDKLDDLADMFEEGKKQIFFFDDFLGNTQFKPAENNFDDKLIRFIHAVQHYPDKLFILCTREYILNDAKKYYARLEQNNLEMAKCVVDMGEYSRWIKGQILYNHLVVSDMRTDYLHAIVSDKNYMTIIDHPNFNPRIIETFIRQSVNETCKPEDYFQKIKGFFDKPESVWQAAYEQLPIVAREMLQVFATMSPPIMYDDWKTAYIHFYGIVHADKDYLDEKEWNNNIRLFGDCFIKIQNGPRGHYVDYFNPGVKDFIINYISHEPTIQTRLLSASYFVEQTFSIYTDASRSYGEIKLPEPMASVVIQSFNACWNEYHSCKILLLLATSRGDEEYCIPSLNSKIAALNSFIKAYPMFCKKHAGFVEDKIENRILKDADVYSVLLLLEKIDISKLKIDKDEIFDYVKDHLSNLYLYEKFIKTLDTIFSKHKAYKESPEFLENLTDTFLEEINAEEEGYSNLDPYVKIFQSSLPTWDATSVEEAIQEKNAAFDDYISQTVDDYEFYHSDVPASDETAQIDNLFATLQA